MISDWSIQAVLQATSSRPPSLNYHHTRCMIHTVFSCSMKKLLFEKGANNSLLYFFSFSESQKILIKISKALLETFDCLSARFVGNTSTSSKKTLEFSLNRTLKVELHKDCDKSKSSVANISISQRNISSVSLVWCQGLMDHRIRSVDPWSLVFDEV